MAAYRIQLNHPDLTVYIHTMLKNDDYMEVHWFQEVSTWDFIDKSEYQIIRYPVPKYFARVDLESTLFLAPNNYREWLTVFTSLVQTV